MARSLAAVPLGVKHDNGQVFADRRIQYLRRPVRRPVVNDDDFPRQRELDRQEPIEHGSRRCDLVVDGNDDRQELGAAAHRRAGVRRTGPGRYCT